MNKVKEFLKRNKSEIIWYQSIFMLLLFLKIFVISPITVKGDSMMPTLVNNEKIIASKLSKINRFDIIAFKAPDQEDIFYIKRIIGLPGDTVEYNNDILYINDQPYEESYLEEYKKNRTEPLTPNFTLPSLYGVSVVPDNTYFVLGDNRQNSKDSRMIGFIDKKEILSTAVFSFWPLNKMNRF